MIEQIIKEDKIKMEKVKNMEDVEKLIRIMRNNGVDY